MTIEAGAGAPLARVARAVRTTVAATERVGRVVVVRVPDRRAAAARFRPGDEDDEEGEVRA